MILYTASGWDQAKQAWFCIVCILVLGKGSPTHSVFPIDPDHLRQKDPPGAQEEQTLTQKFNMIRKCVYFLTLTLTIPFVSEKKKCDFDNIYKSHCQFLCDLLLEITDPFQNFRFKAY